MDHYAAYVLYDPEGWNDKNTDKISDQMKELMAGCDLPFLSETFKALMDNTDAPTTLARFKTQLAELEAVLNPNKSDITTSFVRCIKANRAKKPKMYTADLVLTQLSYTGMLDTLKIQKGGYASRIPHKVASPPWLTHGHHLLHHQVCINPSLSPSHACTAGVLERIQMLVWG